MLMPKTLTKLWFFSSEERQLALPIAVLLQNTSFILNEENRLENSSDDKAFCRSSFAATARRVSLALSTQCH